MKYLLIAGLLALRLGFSQTSYSQTVQETFEVLKDFYKDTNGGYWTDNTGWDTTSVPLSMDEFNDWYGLTVVDDKLVYMFFDRNGLYGFIPPEIGNLINLEILDLYNNFLDGPIPPEIGNLINLERLDLYNNFLDGPIPPEIGNLINLERLDLSNNSLSGSIPPEIENLINLERLNLRNNSLSGSIPPEIENLINLEELYLSNNRLSGSIPPEIGNLINLEDLNLYNNFLDGPIPPEIENLINLEELYLSNNFLDGPIPPEIENLINLERLDLSNNLLHGPIPPEIGNLTNLYYLLLQHNFFTGPLPQTLTQLNLTFIGFGDTDLCVPPNDEFQMWLNNIEFWYGPVRTPDCLTDVSTRNALEISDVQFYPNPANDFVVFIDLPYNAEITVFNILGKRVLTTTKPHIPLHQYSSGMYIYTITSETGIISGKFLKQ